MTDPELVAKKLAFIETSALSTLRARPVAGYPSQPTATANARQTAPIFSAPRAPT